MKRLITSTLVAALLASAAPALAQDPSPGIPMWVIQDEDSTIYVTGTIHVLEQGTSWRSPRLDAALEAATDVWFEISEVASTAPIRAAMMFSKGPALSSLLSAEERQQLAEVQARLNMSPAVIQGMERLTPGGAMMLLIAQSAQTGEPKEDGIDVVLGRLALEQGDRIHGLETVDEQLRIMLSGSDEEQLQALTQFLFAPAQPFEQPEAFDAWTRGDIATLEAYFTQWTAEVAQGPGGEEALAALLYNRNENWAGQIEQMLQGEGVAFVAVGAGHLVGARNLFDQLQARGIEARVY